MDSRPYDVIIIDDDQVIRFYVSLCLSEAGFHCLEASNGQDALDKLDALAPGQLPRIALVDVRMPVLDGFGFVLEARKKGPLNNMEVVFVTSELLAPEVEIGGSVFKVYSKPHHIDLLISQLNGHHFSSNQALT